MIRTVLITGVAGFIGSHLAERLISDGVDIIGLKRSATDTWRIDHILEKMRLYDTDTCDLEEIFTENKIDCIIHLATYYTKQHSSLEEVEKMIDTNVKFPAKLCQLAVGNHVKYFINTGTFFEYALGKNEPIRECDEKSSYNFYASTKIAFSDILQFFSRDGLLFSLDFKLFAPFGEKDNEKLILFLIKSLQHGTHVDFSGGEQRWNFTYVDDIVEAYVKALQKMPSLSEYYTPLNVGYDTTVTIREVAEKLEKISGKKFDIAWGVKPYIPNEIFYANCDNSHLKRILGWEQKFDIDSGLKKTFEYYSESL